MSYMIFCLPLPGVLLVNFLKKEDAHRFSKKLFNLNTIIL